MIQTASPLAAALVAAVAFSSVSPVQAQIVSESGAVVPGYADLAGLVVDAPLVIDATIRRASRVTGAQAASVAAGQARFYVEADVLSLIRGTGALPSRIGYVVDVPLDWRGRAPRLNRLRVLLFARPVPGRPDMIQLIDTDAQRDWTPEADALVRGAVREVLAPDAPPIVTGIVNAFHTPGTLPGEGETQIFLSTQNGAPISLSIIRRPGLQRQWSVALGDIVDQAGGPPRRDSLLGLRLSCGLPPQLPSDVAAAADPMLGRIVEEDYALVRGALGECRTPTWQGAPGG